MTVHYQHLVATERVGGFFRLLFRWRGSIYRHIYGELLIWLVCYYLISVCYRFAMNEPAKREFEKFCRYGRGFADYIPVTFIVGFYVVRVIVRRWTQWENMPWPERLGFDVSTYLHGDDVKSRMIRRTIMRYCNLGSTLCFRDICIPAKKRFPDMEHLMVGGLMTPVELEVYTKTSSKYDVNWWIPFHWAHMLLARCQREGKIGDGAMMRLQDGVNEMRSRCWVIFMHDWIPIPMVYTQVCALSIYLYMLACVFARQYINPPNQKPEDMLDLYVPIFTLFQLMFYLGWMKVAEVLINPFGMDADDFDVNYIIDRNLRTSYTIVDYACQRLPPLEKDFHWDQDDPQLPHTDESKEAASEPWVGSTNQPDSEKTDSNSNGSGEGNDKDNVQLLRPRKTSRGASSIVSSSQNRTPSTVRLNTMASKVRRFLSRQHTAASTAATYDETKADQFGDLLGGEEGLSVNNDRVNEWQSAASSPMPERSSLTVPLPNQRYAKELYNSTSNLSKIEETGNEQDTITKSQTAATNQYPVLGGSSRFDSMQADQARVRDRQQQDAFLQYLYSAQDAGGAMASTVQPVDGSRFETAPVIQTQEGAPMGSVLLPVGTEQLNTSGGTSDQPPMDSPMSGSDGTTTTHHGNLEHAFDAGGRFDQAL